MEVPILDAEAGKIARQVVDGDNIHLASDGQCQTGEPGSGTAACWPRWRIMKRSLAILAAYLLVSAGVLGGLLSGVFWLIQSEPTMAREQRQAPIPPRIAESIERKLVPPPPVVKAPEPIKQAMQEADVALPQAPRGSDP